MVYIALNKISWVQWSPHNLAYRHAVRENLHYIDKCRVVFPIWRFLYLKLLNGICIHLIFKLLKACGDKTRVENQNQNSNGKAFPYLVTASLAHTMRCSSPFQWIIRLNFPTDFSEEICNSSDTYAYNNLYNRFYKLLMQISGCFRLLWGPKFSLMSNLILNGILMYTVINVTKCNFFVAFTLHAFKSLNINMVKSHSLVLAIDVFKQWLFF